MIFFFVFLAMIILPLIWLISIYNGLQRKKVRMDEMQSMIGTVLQQRNDLIPNLVETVKGYAGHEASALRDITAVRSGHSGKISMEQINELQSGIAGALSRIYAVAENYPNLKADQHFLQLQSRLAELEADIRNARLAYNTSVREFNTSLAVFPNNLVAGFFAFQPELFFKEEETSNQVPKVRF